MKKSRIQIASLLTLAVFLMTALAVAPAALASKGQVLLTDVNGTPKQYWRVGEVAFITVIDPDENRDSDEVELLTGTVKTQLGDDEPILQLCAGPCPNYPGLQGGDYLSSADGKQLVLQETGTNTGVFRSLTGVLITKASTQRPANTNDQLLEVFDTDTIFVRYQDPTNPNDISIGLGKIYTGDAPGSRGRAIISITDAAGNPVSLTDVGRTIFVTVTDADENTNPATIESLTVILRNERTKDFLELTLVETGPNTGVFRNVDGVVIVDEKNQGRSLGSLELFARDKDTIIAYYRQPADVGVAPPPPPTGTRTDTSPANPLVSCTRVVPVRIAPGAEASIKVTCTAKVALRALLVSEKLDPSLTLVSGDLRGAGLNLAAGGKVELNYRVRAGAAPGTFTITGDITPATEAGPQPTISFPSSINVAASSSSAFAALKVDSASSDLATLSRDVPDRAAVGREFEVKVTVTAKQALRAVLISDDVGGLTLVGGTVSRAGTITPLNPGQSFTHTYKLTCPSEGTFTISGRAIPVTGAGSQAPISLSSTVVCGPTAPVMAGMGDDNDPHDFAIAQVKVAERNPATIRFTDATGAERRDFRIGEGLFVEVRDADQNADSDRVEKIAVSVYDVNGGREVDLILVETGINTGVFRNTGPLKLVPKATAECAEGGTVVFTTHPDVFNDQPGVIAVAGDDTIYAIYDDKRVEVIEGRDEIKRAQDAYDVIAVTATIRESDLAGFDKKLRFTNDMGQPVNE
ncbi:MAG: BatD family protein, partial [Candidatus Bipolaricaulota bacterium]|nr:BatD family protein [Candidatus Bipolaricaulota bacterium]